MTLLALRRPPAQRPSIDVVPVLSACDRCQQATDVAQTCAPCGERLCFRCYAPWTALACGRCRDRADHLAHPALANPVAAR